VQESGKIQDIPKNVPVDTVPAADVQPPATTAAVPSTSGQANAATAAGAPAAGGDVEMNGAEGDAGGSVATGVIVGEKENGGDAEMHDA
jgi:rhodanese-related sulfurtransferase